MREIGEFVVVSFLIKGFKRFDLLPSSLDKFGIKHDLHVFDNNQGLKFGFSKALFLKKMLRKYYTKSIVWMDPDVFITRYPIQFTVQGTIIALHMNHKTTALDTSVIFLSNNPLTHKLLDMWIEQNTLCPDRFESDNLRAALFLCHHKDIGQIGMLPETYSPSTNGIQNRLMVRKNYV